MHDNSDEKKNNRFIEDKFQLYYKDAIKGIEYIDPDPEDLKKPLTIPKITSKDQIYWVCENCGISNPYFLPKCKDCAFRRPGFLYEKQEPASLMGNRITVKRPISQVISDNWLTVEVIAKKMGISQNNELIELRNKLSYLAKVNYLITDTTGTKYKLNNFEM